MGGPFWARRDAGAWSVIKAGTGGRARTDAARREFPEELGLPVPDGELVPLGAARQAGGKVVTVWALEADLDPAPGGPRHLHDGVAEGVWPDAGVPGDRPVAWLGLSRAREKIVGGQRVFLDRLAELVRGEPAP